MRQQFIWVLVVVAALVVAAGAVLSKLQVSALISSLVVAVGAVVAGFSTTRAAAVLKSRDDRKETHQALLRCDHRGKLPFVRDLNDPVQLGVHPAALVDSLDRTPGFVRRDVMPELIAVISRDHFVLLVGESTAGKSRAAYEAVRSLFPDHRLVDPSARDGARAAVEAMLAAPHAVLWLDDIERFLGEGGFTGAAISSVLGAGHSVVATMRSEEYSYFCGGSATTSDARSRETVRQGWEVLRLATRVDLARSWSRDEVLRARELRVEDPRITEALDHVDQFGVAEYLAAGPQLLAAWRDAWAPGAHPRAAALVLAAVDARRAGIHRAVPLSVLEGAHESYLERRGGARLRPESIENAVTWTTSPLRGTSSLLLPDGNGCYIAFDYLIDAVERDPVPAGAFDAFIEGAHVDELRDVGQLAWTWGRLDQAELAFEHASHTYPDARYDRGYVVRERDGEAAHVALLKQTAVELEAALGRDHEECIEARFSVAWNCGDGINIRRSLRALREVSAEAVPVVGPHHRIALLVRRGIAHWLRETGECEKAARLCLELAEDGLEHLDENDRLLYTLLFDYAASVGRCGDPTRAVELLEELEVLLDERRAPADSRLTLRYMLARQLELAGDYERAVAEYRSLVAYQERTAGRFNSRTLSDQMSLASCIGESGDIPEALRLLRELGDEYRLTGDVQYFYDFLCRRDIAYWTGRGGNEREAIRLLVELREEQTRQFGPSDQRVLGLNYRLRKWEAVRLMRDGRAVDAHVRLRELAEEVTMVFGQSYLEYLGITWAFQQCQRQRAGSTSAGTASGRGVC